MIIDNYIRKLISLLETQFGSRLIYVGLQGSYLRGEENADSDIDIMVVIDELSVSDLTDYRLIVQSLDHYEKSCGFICSKTDLMNWNPLEICHLFHSTKDYYGNLRGLIPEYSEKDIRNYIKISLNNLYHEICHRYIHTDSANNISHLPCTYKAVFFILQNIYYLQHKEFVATKKELLALLKGKNYAVLARSIALNSGDLCDFSESFELLFTWCQDTLKTI